MQRLKQLLIKHFEVVVVLAIIGSVLAIHLSIDRKLAFLSFYYLPVLLSGYYLGRRHAIGTSILAMLAVSILVALAPGAFLKATSPLYLMLDLVSWGGFLFLTAIVVGTLFEAKERQLGELRAAYVGIVEILAKYLESADRYTQGHSLRVANLATDVAAAMHLGRREVENIRTAALLHDIGKVEISGELIRKAAELTTDEKEHVSCHTDKGAEILLTVGSVLKEAVPLVLHHHAFYEQGDTQKSEPACRKKPPVGARIIAVADAYDAIISDRPYRKGRPPWEAFGEIEKNTPGQFDPEVVEALRSVMYELQEEKETGPRELETTLAH